MEELEELFEKLDWNDIVDTIIQVEELNVHDDLVENVIKFVREKNKISFKQWKVLYTHIKYVKRKNKKFKYGY
jgi:hypothetical protein